MAWGMVAGAAISTIGGAMLSDKGGGGSGGGNVQESTELQKQQAQIAQEQWDRYKQVGQPLEDQYIAESQGMGSEANQNKAAQTAAAGVAAGFAGARQRLNKLPGGLTQQERIKDELALDLGEAGTSAGAQTTARQGVVDRGRAAETDALSLVKGLPASAGSMLGSAASGLSANGQFQTAQGNAAGGAFGKLVGGIAPDAINKWLATPSSNSGNYGFSGGGSADMSGTPTYTPSGGELNGTAFNNPSAL